MNSQSARLIATILLSFAISPPLSGEEILQIQRQTTNTIDLFFCGRPGITFRIMQSQNPSLPISKWQSHTNVLETNKVGMIRLRASVSRMFFALSYRTNPLYGMDFYVKKDSAASLWASLREESDPANAALMNKIAVRPSSKWLTGREADAGYEIRNTIAEAIFENQIPVFVLYNIPYRDCGSFSSGGAPNGFAYTNWITTVGEALSGHRSVVILEPDALAYLDCPSLVSTQRTERLNLLRFAISTLKTNSGCSLYVDAGHSNWQDVGTMVSLLNKAGITNADGFSLNVSAFEWDADTISFGESISKKLGDIHFVVDTSRNGLGPADTDSFLPWCNPRGRALGRTPTSDTSHPLIDAFLWIKLPYESDGNCRPGEPPAGVFFPEYALGLAERASY